VREISITYIPRDRNTLDNTYNSESIVLTQSFLDEVDEDFLQIMLSDRVGDSVPDYVIDAILAYSDQHHLDKDVTVVFDYQ
jgi:hypothetical protein